MKKNKPQIRIISVDHERTSSVETVLRHAFARRNLDNCPVHCVFCHLEAGRCGVQSGTVAVEVDGVVVWAGAGMDEAMADTFCTALERWMVRQD